MMNQHDKLVQGSALIGRFTGNPLTAAGGTSDPRNFELPQQPKRQQAVRLAASHSLRQIE